MRNEKGKVIRIDEGEGENWRIEDFVESRGKKLEIIKN